MSIFSIAAPVIGGIMQGAANASDKRKYEQYLREQQRIAQRQEAISNMMVQSVKTADASGAFNPEYQANQAKAEAANAVRIATGNAAGAARTMGYRPGDTAPLSTIQGISNQAALNLQGSVLAAKQNANQARINAYGSLGNAASILSPSMNAAGANADFYQRKSASNPGIGSILSSVSPFLNAPSRRKTTTPSQNTVLSSTNTYKPRQIQDSQIVDDPNFFKRNYIVGF